MGKTNRFRICCIVDLLHLTPYQQYEEEFLLHGTTVIAASVFSHGHDHIKTRHECIEGSDSLKHVYGNKRGTSQLLRRWDDKAGKDVLKVVRLPCSAQIEKRHSSSPTKGDISHTKLCNSNDVRRFGAQTVKLSIRPALIFRGFTSTVSFHEYAQAKALSLIGLEYAANMCNLFKQYKATYESMVSDHEIDICFGWNTRVNEDGQIPLDDFVPLKDLWKTYHWLFTVGTGNTKLAPMRLSRVHLEDYYSVIVAMMTRWSMPLKSGYSLGSLLAETDHWHCKLGQIPSPSKGVSWTYACPRGIVGELIRDSCLRFTIDLPLLDSSSRFWCHIGYGDAHCAETRMAWIAQIHRLLKVHEIHPGIVEHTSIVDGITFDVTLRQLDLCNQTFVSQTLYLFLDIHEDNEDNEPFVLEAHWSLDVSVKETQDIFYECGLDASGMWSCTGRDLSRNSLIAIAEIHERCDFRPGSTDALAYLGLQHFDIYMPNPSIEDIDPRCEGQAEVSLFDDGVSDYDWEDCE